MKNILSILIRGKLLVALFTAIALSLTLILSASAEAVTNTRQAFTFTQGSPCTQEEITFTGEIHGIFRTTLDGSGGFHEVFHIQIHAMGTGSTGTEYNFSDEITQQVNGKVGLEVTSVNSFNIISKGSAPNLILFMQAHMTVNANGDVTASFDNFREDCRA